MDYEKLIKQAKRRPIVDAAGQTVTAVDLGQDAICHILPNREPFLFIDRIVGVDLAQRFIVGERVIAADDPVFQGHFPHMPIYPGVLQLEMLAELFCCLYYFDANHCSDLSAPGPVALRATRMHDAVLQHGVFPGDRLTIVTRVLERTPMTFTGIGQILNGDKIAIAVIGEFYIAE